MGDFTLPPCNTLVTGMTGSGKTTFSIAYLLNVDAICRFAFDDLGRFATRLKMRPARTARECELALATGWVVFNPHAMFPGHTDQAFKWFCKWVYDASRRAPGKKVLAADEIWQWMSPHQIPYELALAAVTGREEHIELLCCTQLPHRLNATLVGQCTELICFRLDERLALDCVEDLGMVRTDVASLPLGRFIARNRLSGGRLVGSLF